MAVDEKESNSQYDFFFHFMKLLFNNNNNISWYFYMEVNERLTSA